MCEGVNPLVEFPADLDQLAADGFLPLLDESHGGSIFNDSAVGHCFDRLVLFHVVLVLLVHVDKALLAHHAQEAAPRVHFLREEDCWPVMVRTVDCKRAVGNLVVCVDQESVVKDLFGYVALHVFGLLSIVS